MQQWVVGRCRKTVYLHIERVDIVLQLADIECLAIVAEHIFIASLEVETAHRYLTILALEGVVAQRAFGVPLVAACLLVGLAIEERYKQILLVVGETDITRVGNGCRHVAIAGTVVVDKYLRKKLCLGILVLDTDAHIVDAVEEESILKLQRLVLLFDVVDYAEHLFVGVRHKVIHDEK